MLESNVRAPAGNFFRSFILLRRFARPLHSAATASALSSSSNVSSPTSSPSSFRARRFWTTDEPLIRALRRRQETYRLVGLSNNARKKAERLEAVQLAKSEIRWTVQHVRALQASASTSESSAATSALNRASRRTLISMVAQMTKCNVPISYLLGSVPFGNLPQELTVRPPILLPRPETEHWATEVVDRLIKSLNPTRERGQSIRIVDLCTGSGCIALLVANALRAKLGPDGDWKVVACDRSSLAVDLARENATKLGLLKTDDCFSNLDIVQADIFSDSDMDQLAQLAGGPFDLILSNPPYIPRREWINLNAEVKKHEDPAALIGERSIAPATTTTSSSSFSPDNLPSSAPSRDRQSYLDRQGLAFHHRLAELLHRPSFSAFPSTSSLPRLVAEYGKGQQRAVEKLHFEFKAPKDRMPPIVPVKGHTLVVVGVGNATTHPNTRHSIGQVVLEPLLQALIQQHREVRMRLRQIRDGLEENRIEALASGRIDVNHRDDWNQPVILNHLIGSEEMPMGLSKVNIGKSGGWAATMTLLIPCSPQFFSSSSLPDQHEVYQIQVALYKPWQAMNLSGVGVRSFLQSHHPAFTNPTPSPNTATLPRQQGESQEWRIENDLLILQDELDLPFNSVKLKHTGSARGHNGIRDIISRLDIPNPSSTSTSVNRKRGANTEVESGPKLSRIKIGIGRPEHSSNNESNKSSWLPSNLQPRKSKPITVDRWVLSPLTQTELQSCQAQDGQVSTQVKNLTLEWIRERCHFLTLGQVEQGNGVKIRSEKDQFGVFRSVWLE